MAMDTGMDSSMDPFIDSFMDSCMDSYMDSCMDSDMDCAMDSEMDSGMDSVVDFVMDLDVALHNNHYSTNCAPLDSGLSSHFSNSKPYTSDLLSYSIAGGIPVALTIVKS